MMDETVGEIMDLQDMLESIKRNLPQLHRDCLHLSEQLYQPPSQDVWAMIGELVDKMDNLYRQARQLGEVLSELPGNEELAKVLVSFTRQFSEQFQVMNRHMDQEDYRDAADILKYELGESIRHLSLVLGDEIEAMAARFQKNLAWLSENFPDVYASISNIIPDWSNYQIIFTKSGMPNLKIQTDDGRWIRYYSSYDPEAEVSQWVSQIGPKLENATELVLCGLGFGYHLLLLSLHVPDLRVVVCEPDEQIFLAAMHAIDLESLAGKVNLADLVVGGDRERRQLQVLKFVKTMRARLSIQTVPVYERLNPRGVLAFTEDVRYALMLQQSSLDTYAKYGMQWLKNRVFNLPALFRSPSLKHYRGMLAGKTAVVVGGGPSLEEDVPVLKELKKHALIISAGSSIQALLHFGIVPHLAMVIDGGDINIKIFENPQIRHIPMLFAPMAHHQVIDKHEPDKLLHFYLREDDTTMSLMGVKADDPYLNVVPTVSGNAIEAAIYLGCTEVVLVGQDLSYPEGRVYASGAKHLTAAEQQRALEKAGLTVENVAGGLNRTTHGLLVTLRKIEELLAAYPEVTFINTARYGAKIEHTRWEPLEQVLERLRGEEMPGDVMERYLGDPSYFYGEERRGEALVNLSAVHAQLQDMEKRLKQIADLLGQLPQLSRARSNLCIQYMQDIEIEWGQVINNGTFSTFVMPTLLNEIWFFDRQRPELEKETDVDRKADLFASILGPLVGAMQSRLPAMIATIEAGLARLESAGSV